MNTIREDAIRAAFNVHPETQQIYIEFGSGFRADITENIARFAEIIKARVIAEMQQDGYVLVPIEPTNEMIKSAMALPYPKQIYKAMIEEVLNQQKATT